MLIRKLWLNTIIIILLFIPLVYTDQTICMSDYESGEGLQYICFCDPPNSDVSSHAKDIQKDLGFSLADFAFNLAGSYFSKAIFITFQSCRNLRIKLDQLELSRIGSPFFRPDIQVKGISVEQVYHLELLRQVTLSKEDYVISLPSDELVISLQGVALVKLDAAAQFSSLTTTATSSARLYIDLNEGKRGDEDSLNIQGFKTQNIFFITKRSQVRLEEGEDMSVRMKQLSLEMTSQTQELSFALTIFAVVILVGIVGLAAVVVHRQKKKRQLKALLRAKNLGPVLESKEIAQGISMKYNLENRLPRYTQVRKTSISSIPAYQSDLLPTQTKVSNKDPTPSKKMDINELLSTILYRARKGEYKTGVRPVDNPPPAPSTVLPETSFYYKESSLSESSENNRPGMVEVDVHHNEDDDDLASYVSKISQQVFILPTPHAGLQSPTPKPDFKEKFITFFSSVSKSKNEVQTKTRL